MIDARALVARMKAKDETRCKVMSNSLESNKKKAYKLEKPQINNEDIKKIFIQLVRVFMKVGYPLKCLIVILVFFVLTSLVKN